MPKTDSGASALAPLLDGSTAGELNPDLARHSLQQLIKLEVDFVRCAEQHERHVMGFRMIVGALNGWFLDQAVTSSSEA